MLAARAAHAQPAHAAARGRAAPRGQGAAPPAPAGRARAGAGGCGLTGMKRFSSRVEAADFRAVPARRE